MSAVTRRNDGDGTVQLECEGCTFTYMRPRPGVVYLVIRGKDRGQFAEAAMHELEHDLDRWPPVELYVDTSLAGGVVTEVSEAWSGWFKDHRAELKSVSILVRSRFMHLTVEVAKLFSRTGEMIRVYLDPGHFEEAVARACPGFRVPDSTG